MFGGWISFAFRRINVGNREWFFSFFVVALGRKCRIPYIFSAWYGACAYGQLYFKQDDNATPGNPRAQPYFAVAFFFCCDVRDVYTYFQIGKFVSVFRLKRIAFPAENYEPRIIYLHGSQTTTSSLRWTKPLCILQRAPRASRPPSTRACGFRNPAQSCKALGRQAFARPVEGALRPYAADLDRIKRLEHCRSRDFP